MGLDAAVDPEGSNERVPTEGGVVAAHEGIQGVGDVGEAFAWSEPTAMLTITPVAAPMEPEPMPEPEPEPIGPGFDVTLESGLNMISIPLMPEEPYTAKSLAEMIGATIVIQLNAAMQHFVGYTVADGGDGFGIEGGKGYIVNTPDWRDGDSSQVQRGITNLNQSRLLKSQWRPKVKCLRVIPKLKAKCPKLIWKLKCEMPEAADEMLEGEMPEGDTEA